MKNIILKPKKENSLKRFHPWVFSGAIRSIDDGIEEGDTVKVLAHDNEFLGIGHYQKGSITVRIISFENTEIDNSLWENKVQKALDYRNSIRLANSEDTNTYRLIFAEGDGFPGLIADIYDKTAVIQCHTYGMFLIREQIAMALKKVLGDKLEAVYDKSAKTIPNFFAEKADDTYLLGNGSENQIVTEYGNKFYIDWVNGQKTGFFVDQRESRKLLGEYSKGKKVLNTFSYTGGFSIYALNGGAEEVHSVDSSKHAIELTDKNVALNNMEEKHTSFSQDVFDFFKGKNNDYDIIVLDPPAFAKHMDARHKAVMGYKRINKEAISRIAPGGILFTFSCSQVVDKYLFAGAITSAAIEAGRNIRIMHHLSQPPDHPVSIFHPEGEYLKGFVLYVE